MRRMSDPQLIDTRFGPVEITVTAGDGATVLFFPGGHSSARTPSGTDLYTSQGLKVVAFSRPGYGRTGVGRLTAAEFVAAVSDVITSLACDDVTATVGLSFGGLQAVEVAVRAPHLAPRLVLHSCAPSSRPFPDSVVERLRAPVAFGPRGQVLTWAAVHRLVRTDAGLRLMMSSLSRLPIAQWWPRWGTAERAAARSVFAAMGSGSGFVTDLAQATTSRSAYRRSLLTSVPCPTLITASPHDGGVSFEHALDQAKWVANSRLVDTGAETHFAWLGSSRRVLENAIADFLT
jgi:pimeloyl-ACP methyl ester carboxylesterase